MKLNMTADDDAVLGFSETLVGKASWLQSRGTALRWRATWICLALAALFFAMAVRALFSEAQNVPDRTPERTEARP